MSVTEMHASHIGEIWAEFGVAALDLDPNEVTEGSWRSAQQISQARR